ncbi:MAG: hypothetical protein FH761_19105 [Firmicutes bacterium]|nr:hypothetical protein [Bacillota bacterium]
MKISSRITFFGNCREAIEFYKEVFEIENVNVETFEDSKEMSNMQLSEDEKRLIFRSELKIKDKESYFSIIMADSPVLAFNKGYIGNKNNVDNITFEVSCITREQIKEIYEKLSAEGKINISLQTKNSYKLFGSLIDKYGVCWNLYC